MSGWISVKDRLPDDEVLVCLTRNPAGDGGDGVTTADCKPKHIYLPGKLTRGGANAFSSVMVGYTITHWMSLPEPPKEEHHEKL